MKNLIKVSSIIFLMIFSFYYTEKIALYAQNNSPLKKEIIVFKENNNISSLNATINGSEIIPGMNGLTVNVEKSYNTMKTYNSFHENNIIYEEVKPTISLNDYPEKIIVSGNPQKKAVTLLISNKNTNINYFRDLNVNYTYLTDTKFCIIIDESSCYFSKQRVKPTIILNNSNFIRFIDEIKSGSIIYVDDNLDKMYIDVLIKHIKFYNLNILKLDEHLSESNHI